MDDDIVIFKSFESQFTYLKNYNEIRKNLYKSNGKQGSIGHRIINKNLFIFYKNLLNFENLAEPLKKSFTHNLGFEVADIFDIANYPKFFTQEGISQFNRIIGNRLVEQIGDTQQKGLNQIIKEYVDYENAGKSKAKKIKLSYFKKFENQILFRPDSDFDVKEINCNDDLITKLQYLIDDSNFISDSKKALGFELIDTAQVYISKKNLTSLSKFIFTMQLDESHFAFKYGLELLFDKNNVDSEIVGTVRFTKKLNNLVKEKTKYLNKDYFSLDELNNAFLLIVEHFNLSNYTELDLFTFFKNATVFKTYEVWDELKQQKKVEHSENNLFTEVENNKIDVVEIVDGKFDNAKPLYTQKGKGSPVEKIKNYLDSIKELVQFMLLFKWDEEIFDKLNLEYDSDFYKIYDDLQQQAFDFLKFYNDTATFLTKKEVKKDKILLKFDHSKDLGGWTESYTEKSPTNLTQYGGYLFRKKLNDTFYEYYLGFSKAVNLFKCHEQNKIQATDKCAFERLEYYQMDDKSFYATQFIIPYQELKMEFVKYFDSFVEINTKSIIDSNNTLADISRAHNSDQGLSPKGYFNFLKRESKLFKLLIQDSGFKELNSKNINAIKAALKNLDRIKIDEDVINKEYTYFEDIMEAVSKQLKKHRTHRYFHVSKTEWDKVEKDNETSGKPFLLFKIQNKDMKYLENKKNKTATKNLHTLYFETLMQGNQNVYDIGSGAIYFRKKSIFPPDSVKKNGHHFEDKKNLKEKFKDQYNKYPERIFKNKRYSKDQYSFHLSISCCYTGVNKTDDDFLKKLNSNTIQYLREIKDFKLIGIDRGERHLLYISVINTAGVIEKQYSLNLIENKGFAETDYRDRLHKKEIERLKARQNWDSIENIKELKKGYLSQAVHKVVSEIKANDFKAIIVMEDLNNGFKKERTAIEKQVYQSFENALIEKLSFWVDKSNVQSLLAPLQLAKPELVSNLDKIKQNGFILYVPAAYTSKIDPATGFMYMPYAVDLSKFSNMHINKVFTKDILKFHYCDIAYFKFDINFKHNVKVDKKDVIVMDKVWTVCAHEEAKRFSYNKKDGVSAICVTEKLIELFKEFEIRYEEGGDLNKQIIRLCNEAFYKKLFLLIKLALTLRHTDKDGNDNIISPVKDKNGKFFIASLYNESSKLMPDNADANGAFHIALKGKFILDKLINLPEIQDSDYNYRIVDWYDDLARFHE